MKKKIAVFLIIANCFTATAFAENTAEVVNRNGVISVTGKTSPDTTVTLTVKSADDDSGLYAIKEAVSAETGDYSFNFKLRKRETAQEVYRYILSIIGDGEFTDNITVYSEEAIAGVARDIKDGKLGELLDDLLKAELVKSFGLNLNGYNALPDKSDVVKAFYEDAALEGITDDEITDIFNKEIVLFKSKTADKNTYYSLLGADFEERELSDFTKERIYETKNYSSIKEYENQIAMFEALNKVNNAKYSQLEDIFNDSKELLTLDKSNKYNTYRNMTASQKREVNESIVSKLLKNPAKTTNEFINIFEAAVDDADKGDASSGSSVNRGGNSGSSYPGGKGSTQSNSSFVILDNSDNEIPEPQKIFSDVELEFWGENSIRVLTQRGIINGYEDGTFRPGSSITREEFVTILVKAFNLSSGAECDFEDVGKDKWFYSYVASAYNEKIVSGISATEFGAGRNVTRQDVAVMIARVMGLAGEAQNGDFADDAEIAEYAKASVYVLKNNGIINGKGNNIFDPYGECTRAECAVMISKSLNKQEA